MPPLKEPRVADLMNFTTSSSDVSSAKCIGKGCSSASRMCTFAASTVAEEVERPLTIGGNQRRSEASNGSVGRPSNGSESAERPKARVM